MPSNCLKIEINALREGMFVSNLDRPWHETPFPLQGFYIRNDDDLRELSNYCKHAYVDVKREKTNKPYDTHTKLDSEQKQIKHSKSNSENLIKLPPIVIKSPQKYDVTASINKEVSRASKLHQDVFFAIDKVYSTVEQGGEISLKETENVADGMVESVIRNPDALVWLAKMNDQDAYGYRHSVSSSIWALVFGRHLGLDKVLLKTLAMGVLLCHIGKTKLDSELLVNSRALEGEALHNYQAYVLHSAHILESLSLPKGVMSIAEFHQERHNGTGFPKGLTGEKIPLLAKIAGLVDYYQELITPRGNAMGLSPLEAVSQLFELRNITFQEDLVERFIEAVGIYPTGTLVELSSNEVGIVTGHNQDRRLLPKVMVVLDEYKQPFHDGKVVDLKERNSETRHEFLYISSSLPKGAYDIDETEFLLTGAKSRWSWKHLAGTLAAS